MSKNKKMKHFLNKHRPETAVLITLIILVVGYLAFSIFAGPPPQAPFLKDKPGVNRVSLYWGGNISNGTKISDYIVEYKLSSDTDWTIFDSNGTDPWTDQTIILDGLKDDNVTPIIANGAIYDFRVSSLDDPGIDSDYNPSLADGDNVYHRLYARGVVVPSRGESSDFNCPPGSTGCTALIQNKIIIPEVKTDPSNPSQGQMWIESQPE